MKLKLADGLVLPLEVVTEKLAWLGRTGSGKTYGAMKLAELMLEAGAQIGVLDPVGVWRGLRVPATKGGRAFDVVIFGGLYGDLPLEPSAGELVADLVCDRGLSFVLDVSQFIPSEQQRFVQAFGSRFFQRRKAAPAACHLFLEECQEFIPENPSGQEAVTLGVMQRLWKLGRNFGIGGSLISQRPQEIAKKALNMSGTLFAFQMTGPQERKTVRSWVADHGVEADIESALQTLAVGQAHVESPTFLGVSKTVRILPRVTADLSSTPKVGGSTAAKRSLTPIDVAQLTASMAATIERAKADDPRELRKRIKDLERQVAGIDKASTKVARVVSTPKRMLSEADRVALEKATERVAELQRLLLANVGFDMADLETRWQAFKRDLLTAYGDVRDEFVRVLERKGLQTVVEKLSVAGVPSRETAFGPSFVQPAPAATRTLTNLPAAPAGTIAQRVYTRGDGDHFALVATKLSTMPRAMLTALAQHPAGLTKRQIRVHTGYADSGPVSKTFAWLLAEGYVAQLGPVLQITPAGVAVLGTYDPLPIGDDLRAWLLEGPKLTPMEKRLLSVICGAYPHGIRKKDARDAAAYADSGPVSAAFAKLVAYNYAVPEGTGVLKAAPELFTR